MGKRQFKKMTQEILHHKMNYDFSRDAEWYKRTQDKRQKVKEDLNKNFYNEERKKQKIDFILKLKRKLNDYTDAIKFQSRYKKIRFIERRKLERKLIKINKEIKEEKDKDALKEKEGRKNDIINDLNYVKYYPTTYKYYSLFPLNDKDKKEMVEKREKMRRKIEFFVNRKHNKEKELFEEENDIKAEGDDDINKDEEESNEQNDNNRKSNNEEEESNKMEMEIERSNKLTDDNDDKEVDTDNDEREDKIIVKADIKKQSRQEAKTKKDKLKAKKTNEFLNDYEALTHKKKKPFKDDFFIIDETEQH